MIGYIKALPDGSTLLIEEVRVGRKRLATLTLRKFPAAKDFSDPKAALLSNARSDGAEITVIKNPAQIQLPAAFARTRNPASEAPREGLACRAMDATPIAAAFRCRSAARPHQPARRADPRREGIRRRSEGRHASEFKEEARSTPERPLERRGLIDRCGLDAEYVERDRVRGLDERRVLLLAQEIIAILADASIGTAEASVLQAILTGEEVGSAEMQKLALPVRRAIDALGAEAVELGLISAESFERNRGSYLHRVYLKDEAGDMYGGARGGSRRRGFMRTAFEWIAQRLAAIGAPRCGGLRHGGVGHLAHRRGPRRRQGGQGARVRLARRRSRLRPVGAVGDVSPQSR